jgi:hypothetical protein
VTPCRQLSRVLLGACGVLLIGFGLLTLSDQVAPRALRWLPVWLAGAVATDDGVLIPLTLATGWLLVRWHRAGATSSQLTVVRTALLYIGVTTLIALPLIHRQGKGANPTSLARNYLRDWLVLEAAVVAVAGIALLTRSGPGRRARATARRRERSGRPGGTRPGSGPRSRGTPRASADRPPATGSPARRAPSAARPSPSS